MPCRAVFVHNDWQIAEIPNNSTAMSNNTNTAMSDKLNNTAMSDNSNAHNLTMSDPNKLSNPVSLFLSAYIPLVSSTRISKYVGAE